MNELFLSGNAIMVSNEDMQMKMHYDFDTMVPYFEIPDNTRVFYIKDNKLYECFDTGLQVLSIETFEELATLGNEKEFPYILLSECFVEKLLNFVDQKNEHYRYRDLLNLINRFIK